MPCYDFPLMVLHEKGGTCPRYNGGVCHPLPTPVAPYVDEEAADAVRAYEEAITNGIRGRWIRATGATQVPAKEGRA